MADLLLIRPYQVAAQRRPRTEERPQATGQGSEGLTTQRPVTEEMTLPRGFPGGVISHSWLTVSKKLWISASMIQFTPFVSRYPDHQSIQRIVLAAAGSETVREPEELFLIGVTTRKCSECTTSWTKHERAARWYVRSTLMAAARVAARVTSLTCQEPMFTGPLPNRRSRHSAALRPNPVGSERTGHWLAAHSINSSARAKIDCGTVRPSALAVLRLMISEYFVGC